MSNWALKKRAENRLVAAGSGTANATESGAERALQMKLALRSQVDYWAPVLVVKRPWSELKATVLAWLILLI